MLMASTYSFLVIDLEVEIVSGEEASINALSVTRDTTAQNFGAARHTQDELLQTPRVGRVQGHGDDIISRRSWLFCHVTIIIVAVTVFHNKSTGFLCNANSKEQ